MDVVTARAIINTAIEGDFDVDMPELETQVIDVAEKLYSFAQQDNNPDKYIKEIILLGDAFVEPIVPSFLKEQLWTPPEIKGEIIDMPVDVSTVNDMELRRFYSVFGAYLSRAKHLVSQEQTALANATHMSDSAYRKAYVKYNAILESEGQRATKDLVEANIRTKDEEFQKWQDRVIEHTDKLNTLKALSDIYSSNCDRISREATMRHNEWERSRK